MKNKNTFALAAVLAGALCSATVAFSAPRVTADQNPPSAAGVLETEQRLLFDVRNGDQQGKLMLGEQDLVFESLTDARHSRTWKYTELREISKKRKEVSVKPFKGSKYSFQFPNNETRDRLYKLISDRILAARLQGKKP